MKAPRRRLEEQAKKSYLKQEAMQPRSSNRNKGGEKDGETNYLNRDYKTALY